MNQYRYKETNPQIQGLTKKIKKNPNREPPLNSPNPFESREELVLSQSIGSIKISTVNSI